MGLPSQTLSALSGGAVALLYVLSAREAAASSRSGAQWYVETVGPGCSEQRGALEREIALACSAVGGTCHVTTTAAEAELRVVLDCTGPDDSWTLVTRTIDGTVLASIELVGPRADRLREAGVEVARDAAPERSLAIETLRNTIPNEAPVATTHRGDRFTLLTGARASSVSGIGPAAVFGLHVAGGLALAKSARAVVAVSGEAGGSGASAVRQFRGGAGLAFGAPFDETSVFGFAAEAGLAATSAYGPPPGDGSSLPTKNTTAGYAQGTVTLQIPRGWVRPFFALSGGALSGEGRVIGSSEVGLAFALF